MKASPEITKVISTLKNKDLSTSDRSLLISAILKKVAALPLSDILYCNDKGILFVNGRKVDAAETIQLRESALKVLEAKAFRLIREQVVYTTFVQAAHKSMTPEDLIFGKAALWWGNKEDEYLKILAAEDRNGNSSHLLGDE